MKEYDETEDLSPVLVGRRIVAAQRTDEVPTTGGEFSGYGDTGLLTLDDGTKVYAVGNDGGCACNAGCYALTHLAAVDNVITSVRVEYTEEDPYGSDAAYSIFVVADNTDINVAEFRGSDGNGYYGTGFRLLVVKP